MLLLVSWKSYPDTVSKHIWMRDNTSTQPVFEALYLIYIIILIYKLNMSNVIYYYIKHYNDKSKNVNQSSTHKDTPYRARL